MLVESIGILNFRGIESLSLTLHPRLTVIVGANGSGKTSLLDVLAIGLSQYVARLVKPNSGRRIADTDLKIGASSCRLEVDVSDGGTNYGWTIVKQGPRERVLSPQASDYRALTELVKKIAERQPESGYLEGEVQVIFYDQRRTILEIPKRKRSAIKHEATSAFMEGLDVGGINFRTLTYWFGERESIELRLQQRDRSFVDPQLDAVRRAITSGPGLKNPHYRVEKPRGLAFTKNGTELGADQLSTGERTFMALAADLARRLALVNPEAIDPLQGSAIVLIDEIELHLHPVWQRQVVPWLTKTFPNCQFVLSTHSPQVLGEIHAESIRVLSTDKNAKVRLDYLDASFGRDSNYLLASAFGADERRTDIKNRIDRIDDALAESRLDDAAEEIRQLREQVEGSDPQVDIAEARLARRLSRK